MNFYFFIIYIFFVICIFVPTTAYAYLDPGTGNALIYVVLSLVGAFLYFIKGLYYKIAGKKGNDIETSSSEFGYIVIFSEGKAYWHVFKPIVEQLIEKKQKFSYYTMDLEDPCLLIDNEYLNNCYVGEGNSAFYKISNIKANIMLSTTPNIGSKDYPISRSKGIKKLIFTSHSFDDYSFYRRGSLDNYDAVFLVGKFEIPIIKKLENVRNLKDKELIPAGLPYLDELIENNCKSYDDKEDKKSNNITVLLAPSWGKKGFLSYYGVDFIERLVKQNYDLIIRPHPQSLKVDKKLLNGLKEKLNKYQNVFWDYNADGSKSFQKADILISDTSAVRFDFAIAYQKPFIKMPISVSSEALQDFEISDIGFSWNEQALESIGFGYLLKEDEIEYIDKVVTQVLQTKNEKTIENFKNDNIYNVGLSKVVISNYIINENVKLNREKKDA
ncbi:MAG: CDP-glycerol glycerophosphotransferase family protein [Acidaminococcaceae bacterium]|nr:CDP-glycerol glycerophosphotransferase family protein [Acidaminococcaceae bacterium]